MAPRSLLVQNRNKSSKNNIFIKKLNHALVINSNLRKRVNELSEQNKQLSITRNNLSLEKMSMQTEINSIKNSNVQLKSMHNIMIKKINTLEETIQSSIPALVTLSQCFPSMLETVHEISKFEIKDCNKEKKEKQTKTVRPMINGHTIIQPAIKISRFDMSPIIESPITEQTRRSTEQTPKRPRKLSYRSSPQCKLNMEPYVRLKDVAAMLKNSKAVPNKESSQRRLNESLGEGPSWLHTPENQAQNSNNSTNAIQSVESSPTSTSVNEVQADLTTIASTSSGNMSNTLNETEERHSNIIASIDSSMMRNVTCRKRTKRSSASSVATDIDDLTPSSRPSRSASKNINYKEKSLVDKLRS